MKLTLRIKRFVGGESNQNVIRSLPNSRTRRKRKAVKTSLLVSLKYSSDTRERVVNDKGQDEGPLYRVMSPVTFSAHREVRWAWTGGRTTENHDWQVAAVNERGRGNSPVTHACKARKRTSTNCMRDSRCQATSFLRPAGRGNVRCQQAPNKEVGKKVAASIEGHHANTTHIFGHLEPIIQNIGAKVIIMHTSVPIVRIVDISSALILSRSSVAAKSEEGYCN